MSYWRRVRGRSRLWTSFARYPDGYRLGGDLGFPGKTALFQSTRFGTWAGEGHKNSKHLAPMFFIIMLVGSLCFVTIYFSKFRTLPHLLGASTAVPWSVCRRCNDLKPAENEETSILFKCIKRDLETACTPCTATLFVRMQIEHILIASEYSVYCIVSYNMATPRLDLNY